MPPFLIPPSGTKNSAAALIPLALLIKDAANTTLPITVTLFNIVPTTDGLKS